MHIARIIGHGGGNKINNHVLAADVLNGIIVNHIRRFFLLLEREALPSGPLFQQLYGAGQVRLYARAGVINLGGVLLDRIGPLVFGVSRFFRRLP